MKRENKLITVLLMLFFAAIVIYIINKTLLSPKSPLEYARQQSGLKLPDNIKLAKFHENWNSFNGDGDREIEFLLTQEQMELIEMECKKSKYKLLPILDNRYDPAILSKVDKGYYKLEISPKDERNYELTILIISQRKLYLYVDVL